MARTKAKYPTTPRLYQRGKVWHYSFSFLGKQYRGSTHCTLKGKAQVEVDKIRDEVSKFMHQPDPTKTTIETIIDIAVQHYENNNAVSINVIKSRVKNLKKYMQIHLPVMTLDQKMMLAYYKDRQTAKPEVSSKTLNKEADVIRIGLRLAHEQRLISFKPSLRRLKEDNSRHEYFTEPEMFRVCEHLPDYMANMVQFAFYSAMRRNELENMQWNWLDTSDRIGWRLDIPSMITKTKTARSLYLIDVLLPPIERQIGKHPIYVFANPNSINGKITNLNWFWYKALEKANLKHKRFHDLRSSAVRYWRIDRGLSETDVMGITGHKSRKIFDKFYNVIGAKDVFNAIQNARVAGSEDRGNVIDINVKK